MSERDELIEAGLIDDVCMECPLRGGCDDRTYMECRRPGEPRN